MDVSFESPSWTQFSAFFWMAVGQQHRSQEDMAFAHRIMNAMTKMARDSTDQGNNNSVHNLDNSAQPPPQAINVLVAPPANFSVVPPGFKRKDTQNPFGNNQEAGPSRANNTAQVVVKVEPPSEVPDVAASRLLRLNRGDTRPQLNVPSTSNANNIPKIRVKEEPPSEVPEAHDAEQVTPPPDFSEPQNIRVKQEVGSPVAEERLAHKPLPPSPVPSEPHVEPNQEIEENDEENEENEPPLPPPVDYTLPLPEPPAPNIRIKDETPNATNDVDKDRATAPAPAPSKKRRGQTLDPLKIKQARRGSTDEPIMHRFNLRRACRTVIAADPIMIGFVNELDRVFPMPSLAEPYVLKQVRGTSVPTAANALLIVTDDAKRQRQFSRNVPMAIVKMKNDGSAVMTLKGKRMEHLMSTAIRDWSKTLK